MPLAAGSDAQLEQQQEASKKPRPVHVAETAVNSVDTVSQQLDNYLWDQQPQATATGCAGYTLDLQQQCCPQQRQQVTAKLYHPCRTARSLYKPFAALSGAACLHSLSSQLDHEPQPMRSTLLGRQQDSSMLLSTLSIAQCACVSGSLEYGRPSRAAVDTCCQGWQHDQLANMPVTDDLLSDPIMEMLMRQPLGQLAGEHEKGSSWTWL